MSGLEALAALGLTCNIFQTISFGRKIIALAKHVYRNRSLDDAMYTYAGELRDVAANIQAAISKDPSTKALSSQDNQILEMSRKYSTAARELQDEVEFLGINAQRGSLLATTKVASTANWRKRRLDRIERELRQTERNLQTGLLGQIWYVPITTAESRLQNAKHYSMRYKVP